MSRKDHNFTFILLQALIVSSTFGAELTVWDSSPVGQCGFHLRKKDLKTNPPELMTVEVKQHGQIHARYFWSWDNTPSRNPTRSLYRVDKKNIGCVILFAPYANQTDFKMDKNNKLPKRVISSTDSLLQSYEIEYSLDEKTNFYSKYPTKCSEVTKEKTTTINCADAFN